MQWQGPTTTSFIKQVITMEDYYYMKKMTIGFILFFLSSLTAYYFLFAPQVRASQPQEARQIDLPIPFQAQKNSYLTLSPQELQASVRTYDHWIRAACRKYALDPALVKAVIHAESQFDPNAVSPKGAVGLMQLDPITVRELGISDPFDPRHNIFGGVRYLRDLIDTFEGDQKLALAAYNAGPTQVQRYNGVPPFKDTNKYLKQVLRYLTFYQQKNQNG
jgi:soluble lytic murein transglycosylase-like protein